MAAIEDAAPGGGRVPVPSQGMLFTDDLPELADDVGYRGPTACRAAGITYRQLDYWARTGLVDQVLATRRDNGSRDERTAEILSACIALHTALVRTGLAR